MSKSKSAKKAGKPLKKKSVAAIEVEAITSLLAVWPSAPTSILEKYVEDVLETTLTRSCVQEAKELLGLLEPKHTEKTLQKRAVVRYVVYNLLASRGMLPHDSPLIFSEANTGLQRVFKQDTNRRLVQSWIDDAISRIKLTDIMNGDLNNAKGALSAALEDAREELRHFGILDIVSGQQELL